MPASKARKTGSSSMRKLKYKRVLLKLSGEMLMGKKEAGLDLQMVDSICRQVTKVKDLGVEIALVIGGGNIFRGITSTAKGIGRVSADYMGMLATVINALALQECLERLGYFTRVMSAIQIDKVCELFIRRRAVRHLEKGRIVIFAGGTGNPYFTTDTAAALRAIEIDAEILLKGTKVDGVYDADPVKEPKAVMFKRLTHTDILQKNLKIMDATAASLCRENDIPIVVFNLYQRENLLKIILGKTIGTMVS